jgi:hypothetical protein
MLKDTQRQTEKQAKSTQLEVDLFKFLKPVLEKLNQKTDRRLVMTFFGLVMAILIHRHRNHGLLLSELGAYLLGPEKCTAGTKRISNLLRSKKWKAKLLT